MRFTPKDITCQNCGTIFRVTRKIHADRKYCGSECYHAWEKAHGKPWNIAERVNFSCKHCGKPFVKPIGELRAYRKAHGKDPLYCSRQCGWLDKRKTAGNDCVVCGKPVPIQWKPSTDPTRTPRTVGLRNKICSSECRKAYKLAEHERLRPAESREIQRSVTAQGYIRIRFPNMNGVRGREVLEHRLVMEQALGRPLTDLETVHHRNGQRDCNDLSNLELRSGNHGPGGDVSAMIRWAHAFIAQYPQFDAEGNLRPVDGGGEEHQKPALLV